jgi:hypothetical protein
LCGVRTEQLLQLLAAYLFISQPQDAISARSQALTARVVVLGLIKSAVRRAVQLEHESQLGAVEADDESMQDMLAPEFESQDSSIAQQSPGVTFGGGRVATHPPSGIELYRIGVIPPIDALATHEPTVIQCVRSFVIESTPLQSFLRDSAPPSPDRERG